MVIIPFTYFSFHLSIICSFVFTFIFHRFRIQQEPNPTFLAGFILALILFLFIIIIILRVTLCTFGIEVHILLSICFVLWLFFPSLLLSPFLYNHSSLSVLLVFLYFWLVIPLYYINVFLNVKKIYHRRYQTNFINVLLFIITIEIISVFETWRYLR